MKIYNFSFVLICVIILLSCRNNKSNKEDVAMNKVLDKVMQLHDKSMPKLAELNNLSTYLDTFSKDSLIHYPKIDIKNIENLNQTITLLQEGDKQMWDWMHNFKKPNNVTSIPEATTYLENEFIKIRSVDSLIDVGLVEGRLWKLRLSNPDSLKNLTKPF